jgi:isoquinoline 1-oxidoreductase beta subunit
MPLGGGFGRRGRTDFIRQAVLIAKQLPGVPVKLIWSREEDMTHCTYHPITKCRIVAGLDEDGGLKAMHVRISGQSILAYLFPQFLQQGKDPLTFHGLVGGGEAAIGYTIPNLLVDHAMRNPHVPVGTWRGVNSNQNAFYLESFVDEVAHAAGQDPLTFRRRLMAQHPKHLAVLNAVAERVGWDTKPRQGVHRGLAQMMCYGSYVAACAEISLADQKLKIHRIVAAIDCGHAVNPEQVKRQIEGSFAFSLSALFYQVCTVREGRIEQKNFDDYNVIRMAEMPQVESIVMPSGGFWGGVGEPTGCVGPAAVVNAIFAATGKRIRTFPLSSEGISIA